MHGVGHVDKCGFGSWCPGSVRGIRASFLLLGGSDWRGVWPSGGSGGISEPSQGAQWWGEPPCGDSVPLPGLCVSVSCTCKHQTNGSPRGSPGCHLATSPVQVLEEEYQPREERAGVGKEREVICSPPLASPAPEPGTAPGLDCRLAPAPGCHLPCGRPGSGFAGRVCDNIWLSGS